MADEGDDVERFRATSGRVMGTIGLVLVAAVIVLGLVSGVRQALDGLVPGCLLAALVIWVVLLRPAVRAEGDDLVLRGSLDERRIPFASIERVSVGVVLAVRAGGRRYTNTAVGRTRRESARDDRVGTDLARRSYGAYVESRLEKLVDDARAAGLPEGDVRRSWARPEIVGLVALTLLLAVTVLL